MPVQTSVSQFSEGIRQSTSDFCTTEESKSAAFRMFEPFEPASLSAYGCRLAVATLSAVTGISEKKIQDLTRSKADVALARQVAMYLAHTKFGISFTEVGEQFGRDRSTVSHACRLVEDKRDDDRFDQQLVRMEYLLDTAMRGSMVVYQYLSNNNLAGCKE